MPSFTNDLVKWYRKNKRHLPWRESSDPYAIWLSEIMLQQTQVATVIAYYNRFMARYPTVFSLAEATEEEVYKLWEGLGYYSRARNLMRCANQVVNLHEGLFPQSVDELKKLAGIGPYTAGAIASIAFDLKAHAVDGNVMRVISRLDASDVDISNPKNKAYFESRVMDLMTDSPGDFNQGLMELGATVCKPTSPLCESCPVSMYCTAYRSGRQAQYPYKKPKPKKKKISVAVLIVMRDEKVLIIKRPSDGLLSNLWGFPTVELEAAESNSSGKIQAYLEETLGMIATPVGISEGKKHIFTHRIWEMTLHRYCYNSMPHGVENPQYAWVDQERLEAYAIPTAFRKLLDLI